MRILLLVLWPCLMSLGCEAADAAPTSSSPLAPASGGRVDGARAKQLVAEGATLLDVRSAREFAGGHAPGAKNIPVDQVDTRLAELDKSRPVVAYCASGVRSRQAAGVLRDKGFVVYDLGSLSAWPR